MRLLTVSLLYPPHYLGGYELICEGVMRAARARGHEVRVLASDYRDPGVSSPDEPGVERSLRSYYDEQMRKPAHLGLLESVRLERHNAAVLARHLREFDPDVVDWWGMGGMSLSLIEQVRRAHLPSVLAIQDPWLSYGPQADVWNRSAPKLKRAAPLLEPLLGIPVGGELTLGGRFLFNSQYMLDEAAAAGIVPPDCAVVTPGVHRRYQPAPVSEQWQGRLLCVGRLDTAKGVDVAIDALVELPGATLTLVGSGDEQYESQLRAQAQSLGVHERVEFRGSVGVDLMPSVYAEADAVVFPVRWQEPWGLVPLEAMAVGRPVVATSRGGGATYLRDGQNALIMPVDDPRALAEWVKRLAGDSSLRLSLREGGFRTAAEHGDERYEQSIVDEFERAARPSGSI